ncbi:MAG: SDR family NAD(P)-dependent oxidoreductase [Deltaproteobacteria bacterium]
MDLKLEDKTVLITGSTAGIGFAIAKAFSSEGARTIINGRSDSSVRRAINELKSSADCEVLGFAGDLSLESVAADLLEAHPRVDILVNNLGIFEPVPFEEIPDEDWRRFFEVNVLSGVRLSRSYLPSMKERNWGRIIFISSESGIQIPEEMIHYGMTKAAQIAVARGLAEHVAGTNITVNSILPGPTNSRGVGNFVNELAAKEGKTFEEFEKEFFEKIRPTSLIKRFASTDEVASLVCYLGSPLASATTGAALRVDGGVVKSAY